MAGLLNSTALTPPETAMAPMPGGQGMPPPGGMGGDDDGDGTTPATPEEQRAYDEFVIESMDLIFKGGKARPGILKLLDDDPRDLIETFGQNEVFAEGFTPAVALGATAATVVMEAVSTVKQKPSGDVILHGGQEILGQLADLADAAGIHTFTQEELDQAWLIGLELYRVAGGAFGIYDPADAEADAEELRQASAEGRTFDVLPQLRPLAGGEA